MCIRDSYFPYLYDFANDEVLEIIEDIIEDLEIEGEMMAIQMTEKTSDYVQDVYKRQSFHGYFCFVGDSILT